MNREERQRYLETRVAEGLPALFHRFSNHAIDSHSLSGLTSLLHEHVRVGLGEDRLADFAYDLRLLPEGSSIQVHVEELETERERVEREEAAERSRLDAIKAFIDRCKALAAARPRRAKVIRRDGEAFVSVQGMLEDLAHWQLPPDVFNEEMTGFHRALGDVIRYLETRERRG